MLPDPLRQYLAQVSSAVRDLGGVDVERYQEEILTPDRANLRIRIRFSQGFLLELNEAVVAEARTIRHLGYRYHFQDERNRLIFRYDNTPHFPESDNFPHHKHFEGGVAGCERPSVREVIEEAARYLERIGISIFSPQRRRGAENNKSKHFSASQRLCGGFSSRSARRALT